MVMPGRSHAVGGAAYRYGMNGQEKENEVFEGASSAEFWMYDGRTGRRFENDPLSKDWQSPYTTFDNNPIYFADPYGLEAEGGGDDKNKGGGGNTGGDDKKKSPTEAGDKGSGNTCPTCEGNPSQQQLLKDNPSYRSDGKGGVVMGGDGGGQTKPAEHVPTNLPTPPSAPNSGDSPTANSPSGGINSPGYPTLSEAPAYTPPKDNAIIAGIRSFLRGVESLNPVSNIWDLGSNLMFGTDKYGNPQNGTQMVLNAVGSIPVFNFEKSAAQPFLVGTYDELRSISKGTGLDAHHAGQAHVFEQIIPGYNRKTAPAILLPRALHAQIPNLRGIVNTTPRLQLAKDALNLRTIGVPNQQILKLIDLNKSMYPAAFKKAIKN